MDTYHLCRSRSAAILNSGNMNSGLYRHSSVADFGEYRRRPFSLQSYGPSYYYPRISDIYSSPYVTQRHKTPDDYWYQYFHRPTPSYLLFPKRDYHGRTSYYGPKLKVYGGPTFYRRYYYPYRFYSDSFPYRTSIYDL
uniref:Uncharacterized protein n=1 Tax=Panagrolaimus sp. PS1159 TaxID=55785 RepID=A0AC35GB40_9BILA